MLHMKKKFISKPSILTDGRVKTFLILKKTLVEMKKSYSTLKMGLENTARLPLCFPPYPHGLGGVFKLTFMKNSFKTNYIFA